MLTDTDLFSAAVEHAQSIAYWRRQAEEAGQRERAGVAGCGLRLTRRQCLARVRYGQARIVDLAIVAETRGARAAHHIRETP